MLFPCVNTVWDTHSVHGIPVPIVLMYCGCEYRRHLFCIRTIPSSVTTDIYIYIYIFFSVWLQLYHYKYFNIRRRCFRRDWCSDVAVRRLTTAYSKSWWYSSNKVSPQIKQPINKKVEGLCIPIYVMCQRVTGYLPGGYLPIRIFARRIFTRRIFTRLVLIFTAPCHVRLG